MKRTLRLLVVLLVLLVAAGSLFLIVKRRGLENFVDADQMTLEAEGGAVLEPGQPAGQTFVARHAGLRGIEFFLLPENSAPLSVTLHVRTDPESDDDLVTSSLPLPAEAKPGFYRFAFPAIGASHGQYYYAFLEASKPGVSVALAKADAYLDGAAYLDHEPLDAQATFRLVYLPGLVILDLLKAGLGWLGLLAVAGLLFVVPGWALLAWLLPGRPLSWAGLLGLAVGVSLALYPLLLLWTHLLGLNLGSLYAWLPAGLGLAALMWRYRRWRPRQGWDALRGWTRSEALWPDLTLLLVLGLVLGVRLLAVRTLEAPMWADSYHHTMIGQLLVDNHGLFDSWQPYANIDSFTYHFGLHSAIAAIHWLTGMPMPQAVIWTCQLLNGLAALALYPLAVRVTGSRWAGVWAVLLAGLLAPMPMFYTNWGRYTQLAGQVILPAAVWLTWEAAETQRRPARVLLLAGLAVAGLALTHYRVLLFYAGFVPALALVMRRRQTLIRLLWIGGMAALLVMPWLAHTTQGYLARIVGYHATTPPSQASSFVWEYNTIGPLDTFLASVWWLAMLVGLAVGLWRRERGVLLVGLWWFLLLIATNPAWLSLPGTGLITNFALFIAAYLPASLLSAVLVVRLVRASPGHRWIAPVLALALAILALWGFPQRMSDLDPTHHALVTRPDVRAATWIQEHTAAEARFLINSTSAYAGTVFLGTDGGWWLPLLAGRQNTIPPMTYGQELGPESDYRQQVNQLAQSVRQYGLDDPGVLDQLREQGVTHVYLGQQQGSVFNVDGQIIQPEQLMASDDFELVYHQDRVWIFEAK